MPVQDMNAVLQKLQRLRRLSDLSMDDLAPEGGIADSIAQHLRRNLRAAQLRKFYSLLKRVDLELRDQAEDSAFPDKLRPQVLRVLPLLAYARGRNNIPDSFYNFMKTILDFSKISEVRDFRRLIHLLEAVVAYHKFHGGQD